MSKKKYEDVKIGNKYGFWIVIDYGKEKYYSYGKNKKYLVKTWLCKCTCGKCNGFEREVVEKLLKNGTSRGCKLSYQRKKKEPTYKKDLKGKTFGKLTVKEFYKREGRNTLWICECECGNTKITSTNTLMAGDCRSCGCLQNKKHDDNYKRLFNIYHAMIRRCYAKKHIHYKNYGGRGIKICDEWLDKENGFLNFYNWAIQNGYNNNLTIDRIDNNGNYEPSNCRWTTYKEQGNNRNNNKIIKAFGKEKTIAEWSEETGLKHTTIRMRLERGWSPEEAVSTPVKVKQKRRE